MIFNNAIIEILLSAGFYLPQTNIFFPWLRIAADLQPISAVLFKYPLHLNAPLTNIRSTKYLCK